MQWDTIKKIYFENYFQQPHHHDSGSIRVQEDGSITVTTEDYTTTITQWI